MSESDERTSASDASDEELRLRGRLRTIAGGSILGLIIVLALADTFGHPAGLHVSELIFGSLLGALLVILGFEAGSRFVGKR